MVKVFYFWIFLALTCLKKSSSKISAHMNSFSEWAAAFPSDEIGLQREIFLRAGSSLGSNLPPNEATFAIPKIGINRFKISDIFPTKIVDDIIRKIVSIIFIDPDIINSITKVCGCIFWIYTALSLLGTVGIDTKPLLSLLSISGLTIGFAAKDILTNTFAGIFILFTRPFKRGWIINVCGFRGRVISVDIRFLTLRNLKDQSEILIPLSLVYGNAIVIERRDIDGIP